MFLAVSTKNVWLVIPIQIYSGIVWGAADITKLNLLMDFADTRKRAMQIAEYNLYASIPLIIAPLLGGWISENVTFFLVGIPLIFVASSILRFASALLLFRIPEPRAKQEYPLVYVLRQAMHFNPSKGLEHSVHVVKRLANDIMHKKP